MKRVDLVHKSLCVTDGRDGGG